ncbi:aldo/keto reductase [Fusobacterium perfoetens]|uniref:aldo/keto reductase n=1 Tax=Fusobacterium perfoetens TaxID=852 RepID=UPI0026F0FF2D|nr:aldo/keto reductase [Fusobacterium perfoetens]
MEYIKLKNTDLQVSRIIGGGCPLGGHGWGVTQDEELKKAIKIAVENGVNCFDTADTYGLGKSEILLGETISNFKREDIILATKFGVRVENGKTFYDNTSEWIEKAVVKSLKRLNTEYIDLYQIHYRDGKTPIGEIVKKLEELKKKGYIRYFGLSNIKKDELEELNKYLKETNKKNPFVTFQEEYSLAHRNNESYLKNIIEKCEMSLLTWGSLGQGILTGKYDLKTHFDSSDRRSREIYINFHGDKLKKNLEIVEVLKEIAKNLNTTPTAVAIRFILDYFKDSAALVGFKNSNQILGSIEASKIKLDANYLNILKEVSK